MTNGRDFWCIWEFQHYSKIGVGISKAFSTRPYLVVPHFQKVLITEKQKLGFLYTAL